MKFKWFINMLLGAFVFWTVDFCLNYSPIVYNVEIFFISKTIILPIVLVGVFLIIFLKIRQTPLFTAFFMTLGIWFLSPLYLYIWNIGLGNFSIKFKELFIMILVFPMSAISISTYSGCLGGLIITTIALLGIAAFMYVKEE